MPPSSVVSARIARSSLAVESWQIVENLGSGRATQVAPKVLEGIREVLVVGSRSFPCA